MHTISHLSAYATNNNITTEAFDAKVQQMQADAVGSEYLSIFLGSDGDPGFIVKVIMNWPWRTAATRPEEFLRSLTLNDGHRDALCKSGLTDETIDAAGIVSVTEEQAGKLGFPGFSGYIIPYPDAPDYYRLRVDDRYKVKCKYLSLPGSSNRFFFPPGVREVLADATKPIGITEGEKKALKATQEDFPTIGISGVQNWKTKGGLVPDFGDIKWAGRPVFITFDSDLVDNPNVQKALRDLVKSLEALRALPRVIMLPSGMNGEKVGLDDYLVMQGRDAYGSLVEHAPSLLDALLTIIVPGLDPGALQARLDDVYRAVEMYEAMIEQYAGRIHDKMAECKYTPPAMRQIVKNIRNVRPYAKPQIADGSPLKTATQFDDSYILSDDLEGNSDRTTWGITRVRGKTQERMTNCTVRLLEEHEVIDDFEPERRMRVRIAGPQGISQANVTSKEYADNALFQRALVKAGGAGLDLRGGLASIRSSIASTLADPTHLKHPVVHRRFTTNFGWDDTCHYLLPDGRISGQGFLSKDADPSGNTPLIVDLSEEGPAKYLSLKHLEPAQLSRVKEFVGTRFIELQPHVITYSCLALVPLALLYHTLSGYNRVSPWFIGRTGAGKSFIARLTQSFFGDFMQGADRITTWQATGNYIQRQGYFFKDAVYLVDDFKPNVVRPCDVTRIVQAYADNTGRGRLRKDASANITRPIRGILLCTGEDLPENSASTIARTIVLRIPQCEKDLDLGSECLKQAGQFPGITAALVEYIIQNRCHFPALVDRYRDHFYRDIRGRDNDARIAGNFGMMAAGFKVFADFMQDVWLYPELRVEEYVRDLMGVRDEMLIEAKEQIASQVFLRQLRSIIDSGKAVLVKADNPAEPTKTVVGYELAKSGHVGINMDAAMQLVEAGLKVSGHTLGATRQTLIDQLKHDGLLVDTSHQIRFKGNKPPRMVVLKRSALFDDISADELDAALDRDRQKASTAQAVAVIQQAKKRKLDCAPLPVSVVSPVSAVAVE